MNKPSPHSRSEVFIIVVAALAGVLLSILVMRWYFDRDNRWFRIVSPPNEKAIQILAVDRSLNAYVGTQQGNLHLCGGRTWRDVCRQVSTDELPLNKVPAQWSSCASVPPLWPAEPGVVVDSIEVGRCSEAATYSKLVILDDGSLWQWQRTYSWVNGFARAVLILLGFGFGLAAGVFIVRLRQALR
jgi:hypothetical protein